MNHVGEIKLDLGDYYDGPKNTIINDAKTLITEFHEKLTYWCEESATKALDDLIKYKCRNYNTFNLEDVLDSLTESDLVDIIRKFFYNSDDIYIDEYDFTFNENLYLLKEYKCLHLLTEDLVFEIIKERDDNFLHYVRFLTNYELELNVEAINYDPVSILCIDDSYLEDEDFLYDFISKGEDYFEYILHKYLTVELCTYAVNMYPKTIRHIPDKLLRYEMCLSAVSSDGLLLDYIPTRFQTDLLLDVAIRQNGLAIKYILDPTLEMKTMAIKQNPLAVVYTDYDDYLYPIAASIISENLGVNKVIHFTSKFYKDLFSITNRENRNRLFNELTDLGIQIIHCEEIPLE